jgi:hypothetical protein
MINPLATANAMTAPRDSPAIGRIEREALMELVPGKGVNEHLGTTVRAKRLRA